MELKRVAMSISFAASFLMLTGKLSAYYLTGSTAILSDALESIVHVFATGIAGFGLWYADKPADRGHPYGHGKVVMFSIGFEGLLIFGAALVIIREAVISLIKGPNLQELGLGLIITGSLGLINMGLGLYLIRVGKRTNSPALVANGQHVLSDMWTSFAVVVGVMVVWLTGILWLDPLIGMLAGCYIVYTGCSLIFQAFNQAMDYVSDCDSQEIHNVLDSAKREGMIVAYHQLRHRRVNDHRWIEVHILFPEKMSILDAHKRVTEIETRIEQIFGAGATTITTHMEPENHNEAHPHGHNQKDPLAELG